MPNAWTGLSTGNWTDDKSGVQNTQWEEPQTSAPIESVTRGLLASFCRADAFAAAYREHADARIIRLGRSVPAAQRGPSCPMPHVRRHFFAALVGRAPHRGVDRGSGDELKPAHPSPPSSPVLNPPPPPPALPFLPLLDPPPFFPRSFPRPRAHPPTSTHASAAATAALARALLRIWDRVRGGERRELQRPSLGRCLTCRWKTDHGHAAIASTGPSRPRRRRWREPQAWGARRKGDPRTPRLPRRGRPRWPQRRPRRAQSPPRLSLCPRRCSRHRINRRASAMRSRWTLAGS